MAKSNQHQGNKGQAGRELSLLPVISSLLSIDVTAAILMSLSVLIDSMFDVSYYSVKLVLNIP